MSAAYESATGKATIPESLEIPGLLLFLSRSDLRPVATQVGQIGVGLFCNSSSFALPN
jgi:hypothetical protein